MLTSIDYQLFLFFNTAFVNPFFDAFIPFFTQSRTLEAIMIFGCALYVALAKNKKLALCQVVVAVALVAVCDLVGARIIKPFFERPRPCNPDYFVDGVHVLFPQANFLLGTKGNFVSFTSNHAMSSAAFAAIWYFWYPKTAKFLFPFALFVAFTRVYCGVHYPFDLFYGIIFGALFAYLVYILTKRFCVHKQKIRPTDEIPVSARGK